MKELCFGMFDVMIFAMHKELYQKSQAIIVRTLTPSWLLYVSLCFHQFLQGSDLKHQIKKYFSYLIAVRLYCSVFLRPGSNYSSLAFEGLLSELPPRLQSKAWDLGSFPGGLISRLCHLHAGNADAVKRLRLGRGPWCSALRLCGLQ